MVFVQKKKQKECLALPIILGLYLLLELSGVTLFSNTTIGILLFITHILACITVGIVLNIYSSHKVKRKEDTVTTKLNSFTSNKKTVSFSSLGEILGKSITNSISTILLIGGFVVIFSVIISILNETHLLDGIATILSPIFSCISIPVELIKPFLSGIVELTNGVSLISSEAIQLTNINIILCAFLLGFGGFSVLLQVFSIISKSGLSIKPYLIGKLLQGIFAAFYTFLALQFLPFLQLAF